MAGTNLSINTISSGKRTITKYIVLIVVVILVVVSFLVWAFIYPNISLNTTQPVTNVNLQYANFSEGGLAFKYLPNWTVLNLSGTNYPAFLTGSDVALLSPSQLTASLISAIRAGTPPLSNFSVLGLSYNATSNGSLAQSALPQNVKFLLGSTSEVSINNSISIGGCSGILFEADNVSGSIVAVSGNAVSQPNRFLFAKAVCPNRQYEIVGEATGQNQIAALLSQYNFVISTV